MRLLGKCFCLLSLQPSISLHCRDANGWQRNKNNPTMMILWLMHLSPAVILKTVYRIQKHHLHFAAERGGCCTQ